MQASFHNHQVPVEFPHEMEDYFHQVVHVGYVLGPFKVEAFSNLINRVPAHQPSPMVVCVTFLLCPSPIKSSIKSLKTLSISNVGRSITVVIT